MEGQISIFDLMEQENGKPCPYNPDVICDNADSCTEFKEIYG